MEFFLGIGILFLGISIPTYFIAIDETVLIESKGKVLQYYSEHYRSIGRIDSSNLFKNFEINKDRQSFSNIKDPFFSAYFSTLNKDRQEKMYDSFYHLLSFKDNRIKLLEFLESSEIELVKSTLKQRDINSEILSPVFSSAGAPLDSGILSIALLIQGGYLDQKFLRDYASMISQMKYDSIQKEKFEKLCISILYASRRINVSILYDIFPNFESVGECIEFFDSVKVKEDNFKPAIIALLMNFSPESIGYYLREHDAFNLEFAEVCGDVSTEFLLKSEKPIYQNSIFMKKFLKIGNPLREFFAKSGIVIRYPTSMLIMKVVFILVSFLLIISSFEKALINKSFFKGNRMYNMIGIFLFGVLMTLIMVVVMEPKLLDFSFGEENTTRLTFNLIKNAIEKEVTMEIDSLTIFALIFFAILQFVVYIFCLMKISSIKNLDVSDKMKLELLSNEENLFDLGLYVGLAGTVISLILLTLKVVEASLMAAYASTLFGIIFTAIIKIVHVRPIRSKLLLNIK